VSATKGSSLWTAVAGGLIGAALTAVLLLLAAPQLLGVRIVREGILGNPQILVEAADALRDQQYAPTLAANRAAIETPFASSWRGAERPEVVLVEFYDYACPYCKASNPPIDRLLKEDDKLKVVWRELPVLGPDSQAAAQASLAAAQQGRFRLFFDRLFEKGRPEPDSIRQVQAEVGVRPMPQTPEFEAELDKNYQIARAINATGTPTFVVGDKVFQGAVGYDALKKAIEEARARG